ncbi:MAG: methyltransferase domain-containing protein [Candidatus Micrarchaeia archaeon]
MFIPTHYKKLKRGPQVILPKDIGAIIAYTNVNKDSICIDAGTGSGWMAVSLAKIAKEVISYDIRDDFIKIAEYNKRIANVDNLILKKGNVIKKIKEKNVDLVVLDMPNSDKALKNAYKALKEGGFVVGYLPHMEQLGKFVKRMEKLKFKNIYSIELIERDILVREQGIRPSTKGVWHTAYLSFGEK